MPKTSRRKGPDKQEKNFRDAHLVVIASEDTYAVYQYFKSSMFEYRKVRVEVLPTSDGKSAPEHVMGRAKDFVKDRKAHGRWNDGDECWLVVDHDRYERQIQNITREFSKIPNINTGVAVSNPCFELWLYLHHEDWPQGKYISSGDMETELRGILGCYNKAKIGPERFAEGVNEAIRRSIALATNSTNTQRWPCNPGTDVYKLVESIRTLQQTR